MADKITWTDKVALAGKSLPRVNLCTDNDLNEIKSAYNGLVDELGLGGVDDNVRIVSINTAGATNKIKSTLDNITDSSSNKPYLVIVRPGAGTSAYVEDNFTIPSYVSLISTGGNLVTEISANTTTGALITMSEGSSMAGFTVKDKTSGVGVQITGSGDYNVTNNKIIDVQTGIDVNNSSAKVIVFNHALETSSSTITDGILCQSGNITVDILKVINSSTVTNVIRCIGDSVVTVRNVETFSSNVSVGVKLEGTSRINAYGISIVASQDGVVVQDGVTSTFDNVKIFNVTQDGFRCDVGTGDEKNITFSGSLIDGAGRYDLNVTCPNVVANGWLQAVVSNSYIHPSADATTQTLDLFSGDKSFKFASEIHVGSPTRPSESVFGEGDSHTNQLVYTETELGVFANVTTAAKSVSGSTYSFPGVIADNSIYITTIQPDSTGSVLTFPGIKTLINTAAVMGSGEIVLEYWNGAAWAEFNGCTTLSGGSYWKYAKEYFERTGSYHIKFDPDIVSDWTANDPMTLGTSYYWIKFRIKTAITTSPVFEQNKVHPHRSEKNPDGSDEYHGDSRVIKKIIVDAAGPIEGNMQNADIYVDQNIGVGFESNRFTAVADIRGYSLELPEDADTSGKLIIVWKGKHASTGNAQFTVRLKVVKPGDAYTNTEPVSSGLEKTVLTAVTAVTADARQDYRVDIDISDAIPARENGFGDEIWFSIQNTTRSGNFDITKVSANYLSDSRGRHL